MEKVSSWAQKNLPTISVMVELLILGVALVISVKGTITKVTRIPVKAATKRQKHSEKTAYKIQKLQNRAAIKQAKAQIKSGTTLTI